MRWMTASVLALAALPGLAPDPTAAQQRRGGRDLILREEILATGKQEDLYTVVRGLRNHFVRPPSGTRTVTGNPRVLPTLYVDGSRAGDVEAMRGFTATAVDSVRYLSPVEAGQRFGLGHEGGAVLVYLRKERP